MSLHTAAGAASASEQLRSERRLRPVSREEEGSSVFHLPDGVFGFTFAPGLKEVPVFAKRALHGFEIHRLTGGEVHLIGFVTPGAKAAIDGSGKETVQTVIYPEAWEQSTALVSIHETRLHPAKKAVTREDGNPFRTLVYPA